MITAQNYNNSALLFGGVVSKSFEDHYYDSNIYELSSRNGILEWKTSGHKLKYPRARPVGMLVPDHFGQRFVECSANSLIEARLLLNFWTFGVILYSSFY